MRSASVFGTTVGVCKVGLVAILLSIPGLLSACGARTGLGEPDSTLRDGGPGDAPAPQDVSADSSFDAPTCDRDADCDDAIACTSDTCEGGRCRNQPRDVMCDDGLFCSGAERCLAGVGCASEPPSCGDGVDCTVDRCDETSNTCVHEASSELCPVSFRCDPTEGCTARALAHDALTLFEVDLPSGRVRLLGRVESTLTDIALHPDGTLYGAALDTLVVVDYERGTVTPVTSVPGRFVGLDIGPDGTLYGAVDNYVVAIDRATGGVMMVSVFPGDATASGDLAFIGARFFATVRVAPRSDYLAEVFLDGRPAELIGPTGFPCIWGLAPFGATLYGLTCEGLLVEIDVERGRATELSSSGYEFFGAGAR